MTASIDDQASPGPGVGVDLAGAFKKIDVDGSGCITKEELWTNVGPSRGLSKKDFDILFDAIDVDKSGDINFAEYSRFMEKVFGLNGRGKRRKSCMAVPTQRDSLSRSTSSRSAEQKEGHRTWRASRLLSTRTQKEFRGGVDLDDDGQIATSPNASLRFFDVEVREYAVVVSDNPGVRAGVALELGWDYNVLERSHIDNFEEKRSKERSKDFKKEKKLTRLEREKILREYGATQTEIDAAAKRAAIVRNARKKSIETREHDKLHENVENSLNKLKKLFTFGRRQSVPGGETVNIERLHPTLMAMMGVDEENAASLGLSQSSLHSSQHECEVKS